MAPQNIPIAVVLTLGNKVALYCTAEESRDAGIRPCGPRRVLWPSPWLLDESDTKQCGVLLLAVPTLTTASCLPSPSSRLTTGPTVPHFPNVDLAVAPHRHPSVPERQL